jgi:hypothetical protein
VRFEAPSIDECPLDPPPPFRRTTNLEREPATGLGALPPFNPASNALSPPRSGEEMARPRPLPCALHARALLATRRSSTSAIETICKHDLRTSKPGDTSTVPREQFRLRDEGCPAFAELLLILGETGPRSNWPSSLLHADDSIEREPRIHGSGAVDALQSMIALPASPAMMAHRGGFAPTRSARTPHVAPPASTTIGAP